MRALTIIAKTGRMRSGEIIFMPRSWRTVSISGIACAIYIELNMVRCGVVKHPSEWEWVGYHEIMGRRQRYRLLDLERLCWRLGTDQLDKVRTVLDVTLKERLARDLMKREARWTESLAVGSRAFVEKIQPLILSRRETEIMEPSTGTWVLQESAVAYGAKTDLENACKG